MSVDANNIVQAITAVAALGAAALGARNARHINNVGTHVDQVHEAVNNTAQKQNRRTDQLTAALTDAGVPVPPRDPPEGDEHPDQTMPTVPPP